MRDLFPDPVEHTIPVRNHFIRGRNVLLSTANMSGLFGQWEQHLSHFGISLKEDQQTIFRAFLSGFALHTAAYPRTAVLAWTIHFQNPHLNVFLGGDANASTVTGRIFTDGLKKEDCNMFYQDLIFPGKPSHRSIVPFEGNDPQATMEFYYTQSEQRPGRFFNLGNSNYALLSAHPDYDRHWFRNITLKEVSELPTNEILSHIETRFFKWNCGCSRERIEQILTAPMADDPEGLFGSDEVITVNCPRCAARYRISRETMEAVLSQYLNSGTANT